MNEEEVSVAVAKADALYRDKDSRMVVCGRHFVEHYRGIHQKHVADDDGVVHLLMWLHTVEGNALTTVCHVVHGRAPMHWSRLTGGPTTCLLCTQAGVPQLDKPFTESLRITALGVKERLYSIDPPACQMCAAHFHDGNRCSYCNAPLHPQWPVVYCSRRCSFSDA